MRHIPILSVRQPWAWAIFHAGKDVENRDWPTEIRGPIGIHASKSLTKREYADFVEFALGCVPSVFQDDIPALGDLERGVILGVVDLVDCSTSSSSPWFVGEFGFVLRNPALLPAPIPAKGKLGWWHAPADVDRQLQELVAGRTLR